MPVEDGEWDEQHRPASPAEDANRGSTFGPGVESQPAADSPDMEPHRETSVEMSDSADTEKDPLPEFDPKVREDFEGLLYLGRLTDTFNWLGHRFLIRTLSVGEILEVGLLHKPYIGSLADVKAYQAAVVAAAVLEVDGKPMPVPLTNERTDTSLVNRFEYILNSWFPPTLDEIYQQFLLLESRVEEVIAAMGKAPASTVLTRT